MIEFTGSRFIALLDASALFSIRVTNITLEAAKRRLYQVRWSGMIHDEWTRSLQEVNAGADRKAIARRRALMDEAFPDALVTGFEPLIEGFVLADPDDRHVVAAALAARLQLLDCL